MKDLSRVGLFSSFCFRSASSEYIPKAEFFKMVCLFSLLFGHVVPFVSLSFSKYFLLLKPIRSERGACFHDVQNTQISHYKKPLSTFSEQGDIKSESARSNRSRSSQPDSVSFFCVLRMYMCVPFVPHFSRHLFTPAGAHVRHFDAGH